MGRACLLIDERHDAGKLGRGDRGAPEARERAEIAGAATGVDVALANEVIAVEEAVAGEEGDIREVTCVVVGRARLPGWLEPRGALSATASGAVERGFETRVVTVCVGVGGAAGEGLIDCVGAGVVPGGLWNIAFCNKMVQTTASRLLHVIRIMELGRMRIVRTAEVERAGELWLTEGNHCRDILRSGKILSD